MIYRAAPLAAAAALAAGCGAPAYREDLPHRPRTATERELAKRFTAFAAALEREDAVAVCLDVAPELARRYRCGERAVRLPPDLRNLDVTGTIYVYEEAPPLLGAQRRDGDKGRLFLGFERVPGAGWAVSSAAVGFSG